MFLLDSDVVLELRKARAGRTDAGLASWGAGAARQSLFLSALSLLEIEEAAARLERKDKAGGAALREWIDTQLMAAFDGRILPVDAAVVRRRAQLPLQARDALLAATALVHGMTLVTRNTPAFRGARVKLFNPWGYSPEAAEDDADWREAGRSGPLWLKKMFVRG